jgi:hypothetical protein
MTLCGLKCPAVEGLVCTRHYGHRDRHAAKVDMPDGRRVEIEWIVYDNTAPPAPKPLGE